MEVKTINLIRDYCSIRRKIYNLEKEIIDNKNSYILSKQLFHMNAYKSALRIRLLQSGLKDSEIKNLKPTK